LILTPHIFATVVCNHNANTFKQLNGRNFTALGLFAILKDAKKAFLKNILYNIEFLALPGRYMRAVHPTLDKRTK
jgi:hypothetical protein